MDFFGYSAVSAFVYSSIMVCGRIHIIILCDCRQMSWSWNDSSYFTWNRHGQER